MNEDRLLAPERQSHIGRGKENLAAIEEGVGEVNGTAEITAEEVRKIAQLELEFIVRLRDVLIEEHSANYRWLMASLLAINAGGLLYVKDATGALNGVGALTAIFFFFGVAFALLIAVFGQRSGRKAIAPISSLAATLMAAIATGEYDLSRVQEQQSAFQAAVRGSWKTQASGWLSFLMFTLALIAIGIERFEHTPADAKTIAISK